MSVETSDRYRVYPNGARSRSFVRVDNARRFAERAYDTQIRTDITDMRPVLILYGSGTNYREVGRVDVRGFKYA